MWPDFITRIYKITATVTTDPG